MNTYIPHTYVLILLICTILLLVTYYISQSINAYTCSSPLKEEYISLKDGAQNMYREEHGIEKCSILLNNQPGLCNVEFNTMSTFVNGLRFRKWKPVKEDLMASQTKSNAEYCYLYDDKQNNTQDVILDGTDDDFDCSRMNPIFQSPLITNVFHTEYRDRAHQVPIKKCVFEIDPNKLKDLNTVRDFWSRISAQDCRMLSKELRSELKMKEEKQKALNIGLKTIQDSLQKAKNKLVEKENAVKICNIENDKIKEEIESARKAINYYEIEIETARELLDNLEKEIQLLSKNIEKAESTIKELEGRIIAQEMRFDGCKDDLSICDRDKTHKTNLLEETTKVNDDLVDEIAQLVALIAAITEKYEILKERKNRCDVDLERITEILKDRTKEYDELVEMYEECQKKNSFYFKEYTRFRDGYNSSSNVYYECLDTTEGLSNRLAACREEVTECVNSLNNMDVYREYNDNIDPVQVELEDLDFNNVEIYFEKIRQRIDRMKVDTKMIQEKYDFCVLESARLVNLIKELRERKTILQEDLKEAKAKHLLISTKSYGSMSDDIKKQNQSLLDKYLAMNEREYNDNIRRQCELDFVSLEKEKDEAVNEGNHLVDLLDALGKNDQTCPSTCDISVSQCIIHHNNPEICGEPKYEVDGVFKVYDKNGNLLETVTIREKNTTEEIQAQEGMEYNFFTFESKNPVHSFQYRATALNSVNAMFKIYDQTDDLVQTIHMTSANSFEQVRRTGLVDLKFFTFETENPDPNRVYQFKAIVGKDGDLCSSKSSESIMWGTITGKTRYKKIHLYRGITCLELSSPGAGETPQVEMTGKIIRSTEFKRVSLATGTNKIEFSSSDKINFSSSTSSKRPNQATAKLQLIGARGGNASTVGSPGPGRQYFCSNGPMPESKFRVAVKNRFGRRSPYDDLVLEIGSGDSITVYKDPKITFYAKSPFTGSLVLQGNDGNGYRDIMTKQFRNKSVLSFGCTKWP